MNKELVHVVDNFSHERINHLKRIVVAYRKVRRANKNIKDNEEFTESSHNESAVDELLYLIESIMYEGERISDGEKRRLQPALDKIKQQAQGNVSLDKLVEDKKCCYCKNVRVDMSDLTVTCTKNKFTGKKWLLFGVNSCEYFELDASKIKK